jgi:hypothetical protein
MCANKFKYCHLAFLLAGTLVVIAAASLPTIEPLRSWRIAQTKTLVGGISMRVEDVYLFPSGGNKILRVRCRYWGGGPNKQNSLRATIRAASDLPEIDPEFVWQVGVPEDGRGGIPMIWEFRTAPEGTRKFILRLYCTPSAENTAEHFVNFEIPFLPKLTPNGEINAWLHGISVRYCGVARGFGIGRSLGGLGCHAIACSYEYEPCEGDCAARGEQAGGLICFSDMRTFRP